MKYFLAVTLSDLWDKFRHLDDTLRELVRSHGGWTYAILFLVVFCETGLVIFPWLPGDSLLFAVGGLCGQGVMKMELVIPLLIAGSILGDTTNYAIGQRVGPKVFKVEGGDRFIHRLLSRKHLAEAHSFYERHGGKAVTIGKFVPLVRTFVPFVAGAGAMNYTKFILFNVLGALLWVGGCTTAGYLFGNLPFIKDNFEFMILGIVFVSLIPVILGVILGTRKPAAPEKAPDAGEAKV